MTDRWRFTMEEYGKVFHPRFAGSPDMTPGAWLAKKKGCTCSRLDNLWGYGSVYNLTNDVEFLVAPGCPLHDLRNEDEIAPNASGSDQDSAGSPAEGPRQGYEESSGGV